ncbi:MAG: M48 family metallopeptidase, partial [Methylocella sp.]
MISSTIIFAIVLSGVLGVLLMYRQAAAVASHRERVPDGFTGLISAEEHRRAAAYTMARTRLSIAETIFDTVLAVIWLMVLLGPLYALVAHFVDPGISRAVAVVVAFALIGRVLQLPFSIYSTFALEARFGFNRATAAMFVLDRIKGVVLSALFGVPLLFGLFILMRVMPDTWWLLCWAGFMALTIAMSMVYPAFIAPMFNKFTPMPDGELKSRIEALLAKCGFASKGLYVMDASTRSTHGNAYFTGFGKAKRIVFFDTLLQNHTPDEILSILAHELGHYKLGHIGQRIAMMAVFAFVGFAFLHWAFAGGLA